MAIAHSFRCTRDLNFDRAAKTASSMCHVTSVSLGTIEKWSDQFALRHQRKIDAKALSVPDFVPVSIALDTGKLDTKPIAYIIVNGNVR